MTQSSAFTRLTRRLRTGARVGAWLAAILLVTTPVAAQLTTGTISGTIIDATKASVPGVTVTITNDNTGLTRTAFTNERGFYEAPNLPVGTYTVSAALQGFGTAVTKEVVLTVGRTAVIDMNLSIASLEQQVTVTGAAPLVETTSATVSNLISSQQVEDLPLVNRDLTQLTFLQPGVVKIPSSGDQGVFSGMGDKFTVAGARGTQNLYLLDGVSNADLSGNAQGASGSYMGAETVQEIQIVTNNYSAEYRSAAGGIVSAITKSGTNTLHGSAFEFFRNDALDAPNYFDKKFDQPKSQFDRHQYRRLHRRTDRAEQDVLLRELRRLARRPHAARHRDGAQRQRPAGTPREWHRGPGEPRGRAVSEISGRSLGRATRSSKTSATPC